MQQNLKPYFTHKFRNSKRIHDCPSCNCNDEHFQVKYQQSYLIPYAQRNILNTQHNFVVKENNSRSQINHNTQSIRTDSRSLGYSDKFQIKFRYSNIKSNIQSKFNSTNNSLQQRKRLKSLEGYHILQQQISIHQQNRIKPKLFERKHELFHQILHFKKSKKTKLNPLRFSKLTPPTFILNKKDNYEISQPKNLPKQKESKQIKINQNCLNFMKNRNTLQSIQDDEFSIVIGKENYNFEELNQSVITKKLKKYNQNKSERLFRNFRNPFYIKDFKKDRYSQKSRKQQIEKGTKKRNLTLNLAVSKSCNQH